MGSIKALAILSLVLLTGCASNSVLVTRQMPVLSSSKSVGGTMQRRMPQKNTVFQRAQFWLLSAKNPHSFMTLGHLEKRYCSFSWTEIVQCIWLCAG